LLGFIRDYAERIQEFQLLLEKQPPKSANTNEDVNTIHSKLI
jgi:hypothetical protein